jgi:hypothetical protein
VRIYFALLPLCLVLVACGPADPCASVTGACVTVHVESSLVRAIDQLDLDIRAGTLHDTAATRPADGNAVALPLATAIELALTGAAVEVRVAAAGELGGVVVGTGAASTTVAPGEHASMRVLLTTPGVCVVGGSYCGGDKLSGTRNSLYRCDAGGAATLLMACAQSCEIRPTQDDACQ